MSRLDDSVSTDRAETLDNVRQQEYDLAIVGGGIAGAGVARDAAMRGLDTVLIERGDFGAETTAWSTRLVHGGLRYLEQYEFGLVFESLQERETLADIAPHLVDPLEFLIPQYDESLPARIKVGLGMLLYDVLSYNKTMPTHERLTGSELAAREPALPAENLQGGFVYHDRQVEFVERLCLETVLDAAAHGADVLNHATVTDIRREGGEIAGVDVRDTIDETRAELDSKAVLNATGPWADDIVGEETDDSLVRGTKGIHLVVPSLTDHALTLPTTDGRVIFVVPWNGMSLLGTTDTDFTGDPAAARATASDVAYLLDEARRFFPDLDEDDIVYSYAGVRPLYNSDPQADASDVSREHRVVDHDTDGLFSLVGVKITPHRSAAADATDAIAGYLGVHGECQTASVPLPGGRGDPDPDLDTDLAADVRAHLTSLYGSRAADVIDRIEATPRLGQRLCDHTSDVLAQVAVAVDEEYARSLADVMLRRCTVGYEPCEGRDAVETVADEMAARLDWDDKRRRAEIEQYESILDRRHAFRDDDATA